jgi:cyclopropane fatty-acyl-phospholipid synthase-like methyltransferase
VEFVEEWKELHRRGYFKNHPYYQGKDMEYAGDLERLEKIFTLDRSQKIVVIGSGYGREISHLAPKVDVIFGIDVGEEVMSSMKAYLTRKNIQNWVPIIYEEGWEGEIPDGEIDLVYSYNVFQHLSRLTSLDYLKKLRPKLKKTGKGFIQFCECLDGGTYDVQKGRVYEPQVNWKEKEIRAALLLLGYEAMNIESDKLTQAKHNFLWHWAYFRVKEES